MKPTPAKSRDIDKLLLSRIPVLFVVLSTILGLLYAFTVPPLQVPDEFLHLLRAYGLSEGHFVALALTPIPASIGRLPKQFPPHLENTGKISHGGLVAAVEEPLNAADQVAVPDPGMNVNTWIPYVPSAVVILIARAFHASPLAILYLGRLANLTGYVFLTWLALRILPWGRLVLFSVALMPMTLHQAASLSWDSIAFAIAFLFCAIVLRARENPRAANNRELGVLLLSVVVLSLCKVDFALLPLVLLIRQSAYGSRRRQVAFLLICASSALIANALWQYLNHENFLLFKQFVSVQYHTDIPDNIWYLYYNTGFFINTVVRSIVLTGFLHLTEFVGTFGWLTVRLPRYIVWLYVAQLLLLGSSGLSEVHFSRLERGIVSGVVAMGCFVAMLAMWLETPQFYIQDAILHNVGTLYGIQGRHYIPIAFLAILLLSNRLIRFRPLWLCASAIFLILLANGVGILKIKQTYYVSADQAAEPMK
jgi:uncharacterized membrane protein